MNCVINIATNSTFSYGMLLRKLLGKFILLYSWLYSLDWNINKKCFVSYIENSFIIDFCQEDKITLAMKKILKIDNFYKIFKSWGKWEVLIMVLTFRIFFIVEFLIYHHNINKNYFETIYLINFVNLRIIHFAVV